MIHMIYCNTHSKTQYHMICHITHYNYNLLNQVNGGQIVHFSVSNSLIVASRCGQQLCLQPVRRRYPGSPLKPWQYAQLGLP